MNNIQRIILLVTLGILTASCSDQKSVQKGQEFGREEEHTTKDCTNKGFEMLIECGVIECTLTPSDFTKGCTMTAKIDKEYCQEMPLESALNTVDWVKAQCSDHKDPKACGDILKHSAAKCLSVKNTFKEQEKPEAQPQK